MPVVLEAWLCVDPHFPSCLDYSVSCWMVCFDVCDLWFHVLLSMTHISILGIWDSTFAIFVQMLSDTLWSVSKSTVFQASFHAFVCTDTASCPSRISSTSLRYEFIVRWQLAIWGWRTFPVDSGKMTLESSWNVLEGMCHVTQQRSRISGT